jgi:hypothetical protein
MNIFSRQILASTLLFICLSAWSFSAPINSGYDPTFHLSSIWCAWGEKPQICEKYGQGTDGFRADIPSELGAFNNSSKLNATELATPSTQSLFYKALRILVTKNSTLSVLLMRLFNSFLASFVFFTLLMFSRGKNRVAIISSWTVTICPIIISTIHQTNPRSWSYLAGMSSWAFLYLALTAIPRTKKSLAIWSMFAITVLLAFASRWDGALMVIFSSVLVLVIHSLQNKRIDLKRLGVFTLLSALALLVLRNFIPRLAAYTTFNFGPTFSSGHTIFQIVHIFENIADGLGLGIRYHDLGPNLIGIIGVSVFIATITSAMQEPNRWQVASIISIGLFIFLSMFRISLNWIEATGPYGIYTAQLLTVLVGVVSLYSNSSVFIFERRASRYFVISLISFGHSLAFFAHMEWAVRPGSVLNDTYFNLSLNGGWWWNSPIGPNVVFLIGAIAFPAWLIVSWNLVSKESVEINS